MKRLIAVSDSHGCVENLRAVIERAVLSGPVNAFVFLGDGMSDWEAVRPLLLAHNPHMELFAVLGNNDFSSNAPVDVQFSFCGYRILATHGHTHRVKSGLDWLCYAAREREAKIALYGHTHRPYLEAVYGVYLVNPGAVCDLQANRSAYAELMFEDDGRMRPDLAMWKTGG